MAVIGDSIESRVKEAPLCGLYAVWRPGRNMFTVELWFGSGNVQEKEVGLPENPSTCGKLFIEICNLIRGQ
jgi:hypothetical protein